jgi:hypothetical protein
MKTKSKKENYLKMFNANRSEISRAAKASVEEIVTQGKALVAEIETIRSRWYQYDHSEYSFTVGQANRQLKVLRCAWYAKRYGWVA